MFSNPIIITILSSLGISLIVSLAVTLFFLRLSKSSRDECLPSLVENAVQKEIDKRWKEVAPKLEKDLQKKFQESLEKVKCNYQEEKKDVIHLPDRKRDKYDKHARNNEQKENREETIVKKEELPVSSYPDGVNFTYLSVSEGKLVAAIGSQPKYYRLWEFQGQRFYEFACDESQMKKVINNRSAVIDPYCEKHPDSDEPSESNSIKTIKIGTLDSEFNIINKTIIKYCK